MLVGEFILSLILAEIISQITSASIKKLKKSHPITKAISKTEQKFPLFEDLHQNLEDLIESKVFVNEIKKIIKVKDNVIDIDYLSNAYSGVSGQ